MPSAVYFSSVNYSAVCYFALHELKTSHSKHIGMSVQKFGKYLLYHTIFFIILAPFLFNSFVILLYVK